MPSKAQTEIVDYSGQAIKHSELPEDDATEHRMARRITTEWEVNWVLEHYQKALEKEAQAKEEYQAAVYAFRKAAGNYKSAMHSVNQRLEEAIESGIALPEYERDGITRREGDLEISNMLYGFKTRAGNMTKVDAAQQAASGSDW